MSKGTQKTSKLRESARGRECFVRLPGICNHDSATVVLAHMNGGGMGKKQPDLFAAFCCSACHDAYDGRVMYRGMPVDYIQLAFLQGIIRTQKAWLAEGLIDFND